MASITELKRAAGILFQTPEFKVLLLRRGDDARDHAGEWTTPGGMIEDGEDAETTARREAIEELGIGSMGEIKLSPWLRTIVDGVDYTTFVCRVPEPFEISLNNENTEAVWVAAGEALGAENQNA